MTRLFRAIVVLSVCLACAFTLTPASYADRMAHRDARHDVVKFSNAHPDGKVVPRIGDPDVLRVKVAHREHRLSIVLHFASLRRNWTRLHFATLRTDHGRLYEFDAVTSTSGRVRLDLRRLDGTEESNACPRMRYRASYHRDVVRASVPRRCLETPRWLKVGSGVIRVDSRRPRDEMYYVDEALRRGLHGELAKTRKLYRG